MKKFYFILSVAVIVLSLTVSCGNGRADVPEGSVEISVGGNDIMMVRIEPGKFVMGGTSEQTECDYYSEKPEHSVVITKPFYISQTEVTQELWEHVMGTNPSMYKAHDDTEKGLPVINVSWYDCKEFIKKLNELTGRYEGTLANDDLLRELCRNPSITVASVADRPLTSLPRRRDYIAVCANANMEDLLRSALSQNFVPVVDDTGAFIGIITRSEVIKYLKEHMIPER